MTEEIKWTARRTGQVMRGYSQSWAIAESGKLGTINLVAGVFSDGDGGEEAAERNARLIAAAPDGLALAKALVARADNIGGECRLWAEVDMARAIVAKAA
jgi:hypothetical protein